MAELLDNRRVHLIEQLLVTLPLILEVVVLVTSLFRLSHQDIAIALIVEDYLLNSIVILKNALFVRKFGNVRWGHRVLRCQLLVDGGIFLLLGKVLLVVAELVGLHVEKFIIVLQIF